MNPRKRPRWWRNWAQSEWSRWAMALTMLPCLQCAALGIAMLGGERLATACFNAADLVAPDIVTALDLLLFPRRLIATLRT